MKLKNFANLKEFEATKGNEMKTYEEFRLAVMEWDFEKPTTHARIEELAAKEYAKQWVDECYEKVLLPIQLEQLKNNIDAQ